MKDEGFIQIYYGEGKGKTTLACGNILRALGRNLKVCFVQFLKKELSGEILSLQNFNNFYFRSFGSGEWINESSIKKQKELVKEGINFLKESFEKNNFDIFVLDEILYALQFKIINEEELIELIEKKPKNSELILTGAHKDFPKLFSYADLITNIKKIKHPYDRGIKAREGIEF